LNINSLLVPEHEAGDGESMTKVVGPEYLARALIQTGKFAGLLESVVKSRWGSRTPRVLTKKAELADSGNVRSRSRA
jgi:hypothetical protein